MQAADLQSHAEVEGFPQGTGDGGVLKTLSHTFTSHRYLSLNCKTPGWCFWLGSQWLVGRGQKLIFYF